MTNKSERYSLQQSEGEAAIMQEKIQKGEASSYPEAEEKIEKEKRKKFLTDALRILEVNGSTLHIPNVVFELMGAGLNDLAIEALKIGFYDAIKIVMDSESDKTGVYAFGHWPVHIGNTYIRLRSVISDPRLHEIGTELVVLNARWRETDHQYDWASDLYKDVGMSEKSEEIGKLKNKRAKGNWSEWYKDFEKFKEKIKVQPYISEGDRAQILEDLKQKISDQIDLLK